MQSVCPRHGPSYCFLASNVSVFPFIRLNGEELCSTANSHNVEVYVDGCICQAAGAVGIHVSVLFALAVVVTTTSTVYAQCSNATLTGNYPFIYSGANSPGHSVTGKNTFGNAAVGVDSGASCSSLLLRDREMNL
jgi:hypothetical protein